MKPDQINSLLSKLSCGPSKWELDTITYYDRTTNADTMHKFLTRISELDSASSLTDAEERELANLLELLDDMEESDVTDLVERSEEDIKEMFIEDLARKSAIEVLTHGKLSFETMNTACKLSPNDFILCAKRTQDLINAIQGLVIKGETLSRDVAGA